MKEINLSEKLIIRFHTKYVKRESGCWEWNGPMHTKGYGRFIYLVSGNKNIIRAHRFSWAIHNGEIPQGLLVLHKCDNRKCVNPDHLFLGNNDDNVRDMMDKGRSVGRKRGPRPKYEHIYQKIKELLLTRMTYKEIGEEVGVSAATICRLEKLLKE